MRPGGRMASATTFWYRHDSPYYDNIGYADFSDFFYVWLRRAIGHFTRPFRYRLVPKAES